MVPPRTRQDVSLRRFIPDDVEEVYRWFRDRRATAGLLEQRSSFSRTEAESWVRRAAEKAGEDRKFAIIIDGWRKPVGFTALYGLFRQTPPELGILIGGDARTAGVGREAERLTLEKAFDDFGAHKVYGRIAARNRAAKWVVESLGWRREAVLRDHLWRDEKAEDCEIWGVLPEEFRTANS
jgi:RimJ/RimL family protein N-acetyltransferase